MKTFESCHLIINRTPPPHDCRYVLAFIDADCFCGEVILLDF